MKQNEVKVESINIGLAAPNRIRKWAERILPNGKKVGQVTNSQTVNYKTLKPEIGGLFCERVFGPVKDFECSCGTKKMKSQQQFCPNCDVEFTASRVRRYRLGYIKLASPVTHIWYLKGRPSFLSLLLDISRKELEPIVYCIHTMGIPILKFFKNKTDFLSNKNEVFKSRTTAEDTLQAAKLLNGIDSNYLKSLNSISKKQLNGNNNGTYLKTYLLKKYFLNTFKKHFFKKNVFKAQLNTLLNNSYYSNFNTSVLKSMSNSKRTLFPFIQFLEKKIFWQYESNLNQPISETNLQIVKKNSNAFQSFILPSNNLVFRSEATKTKLNPGSKNFKKVSASRKQKSNFLENKKLFLNTAVKLEKTILSKKKFIYKYTDIISFNNKVSINKISSNLNNLELSDLTSSDNYPLLSGPEFSDKFVNFSTNLFNSQNPINNNENCSKKPPVPIHPYYPICSKYIFESTWESILKFEDEWDSFLLYITSNPAKNDRVLSMYTNRVTKQSVTLNNSKYKSTLFLLSGTETIWYLLKTLNSSFVKIQLQRKIVALDFQVKKFEQELFLYSFEKKKLRKLIKLRLKALRRLKLVRYFQQTKLRPEWLILSILPVLPPNLRPIIRLDANQIAVSDLNQLYKRVLDRNKRIQVSRTKNSSNNSNNSDEMRFNQRLLQEAVDALIENGKAGIPVACASNGRAFKSLSDILKGKKGRFRQNLLGKRVDYSGRSVIVVAPELRLHECGLPKEMAIELFQPFLIRELRKNQSKTTIVKAKKLIQQRHPIIWKILQKILRIHPILLNRAPTLHRLGIQAFQPKLVDGRAILLHPLVCPAFNADFDGDQMAVHVPLSFQAQAEAWKLMWSRNNILSSATGQPIIVPSQDMILGCYYLTTNLHESLSFSNRNYSRKKFEQSSKITSKSSVHLGHSTNLKKNEILSILPYKAKKQALHIFSNIDEVLTAFQQKEISLHSLIWVRWINLVQIENFYEKPLEIRVDCFGNTIQIYSKYWRNFDKEYNTISQFIYTTTGRILLNKIILQIIVKQS